MPRRKCILLILICMLLALPLTSATAQETRILTVGVSECLPFVIHAASGEYNGLAMELFKQVAGELQIAYQVRAYAWDDFLPAVQNGEVDLGISCTSLTAAREEVMDFSYPYYESALTAAVREADPIQSIRSILLSWQALAVIACIILFSWLIGVVIWHFEHKASPDLYPLPGKLARNVDIFLSGVVFVFSGGLDYAYYKSTGGRVINMLGRVVNTIFITSMIAVIVSVITSAMLVGQINDPQDLNDVHVGVLLDTLAEKYLMSNDISFIGYTSDTEMLDALEAGEIDAAVEDAPLLQYLIKKESGSGKYQDLIVLPWRLKLTQYGFAYPNGSPLRDKINGALLKVTDSAEWEALQKAYLKID